VVRKVLYLDKDTARLTWQECVDLMALGGIVRPPFRERDGVHVPAVEPQRILCHWCRFYHSPAEVEACMALERPVPVEANGSTSSLTVKAPSWLSQLPELWEFLSKPSYRDGKPRQLGKVSVGLVSGGVQMTLTDPSSSTYCSRQFPTLDDALLAFELGLKEGSLQWKASGPQRGRKRP